MFLRGRSTKGFALRKLNPNVSLCPQLPSIQDCNSYLERGCSGYHISCLWLLFYIQYIYCRYKGRGVPVTAVMELPGKPANPGHGVYVYNLSCSVNLNCSINHKSTIISKISSRCFCYHHLRQIFVHPLAGARNSVQIDSDQIYQCILLQQGL